MRRMVAVTLAALASACGGSTPADSDTAAVDSQPDVDTVAFGDVAGPADVSASAEVSGSCVGGPTPGETCGPTGWECHMNDSNWQACTGFMCSECIGFAGTPSQTVGDCTCTCASGAVLCKSAKDTSCHMHDHVAAADAIHIEVTAAKCQFTLAEAAAGITIGYDIVIDHDVVGITPQTQTGCGQPGPSGLIVFEKLGVDPTSYCLCESGHCAPYVGKPGVLSKGTFGQTFTWDGKAWNGPSDTGTPEGAAFPVGTYTLVLSAKGTQTAANGSATPFEAKTSVDVTLVP